MEQNKALGYLALARKAGRIELGEEAVGAAARAKKARLVAVAYDASDHTWRRAKSFVDGTGQPCIHVPFTKAEIGFVLGRTELAVIALSDPAMALAFLKALPENQAYAEAMADLDKRTQRIQRHAQEEKVHRQKASGKKVVYVKKK